MRTFTIEAETAEMLKGELNQSELVNQLLINYFNAKKPKSLEELEREAAILEAKIKYDETIEAIDNEFKLKQK